jgi:hypothetical protein
MSKVHLLLSCTLRFTMWKTEALWCCEQKSSKEQARQGEVQCVLGSSQQWRAKWEVSVWPLVTPQVQWKFSGRFLQLPTQATWDTQPKAALFPLVSQASWRPILGSFGPKGYSFRLGPNPFRCCPQTLSFLLLFCGHSCLLWTFSKVPLLGHHSLLTLTVCLFSIWLLFHYCFRLKALSM